MYLGKLFITLAMVVGFSQNVYSQQAPAASSVKRKVGAAKKFSVGLGYMSFSESLQITQSNQKDVGFANYAGLAALVDHTWTKNRWVYLVGGGIGAGKASAGGFNNLMTYRALKRSWTLTFLELAANYRINSKISFGGGMIVGNRSADWKTDDSSFQTKQLNKVLYAPEFITRFDLTRKFTLIQSIASPDLRGNTIWRWSGSYSL